MQSPFNNEYTCAQQQTPHCVLSDISADNVFNEAAKAYGIEVQLEHVEQPAPIGTITVRPFDADAFVNDNVVEKYDKNPEEINSNLFKNIDISQYTDEEKKKLLSEVMIRFDTDPRNYLKDDYRALISLIMHSIAGESDVERITELEIFQLFEKLI